MIKVIQINHFSIYICLSRLNKRQLNTSNYVPLAQKDISSKWQSYGGQSPVALFFSQIAPISQEAIDIINEETYPLTVPKGKMILSTGSYGRNLFFVVKGVARGLVMDDDKEITTWINEENEIVGTIRNLGNHTETNEMVQALEHCELVVIPYDTIERLYSDFPETNLIGRVILEDSYKGAEERAFIARMHSAEKRYKRLMDTRPNLTNRIPLKHIASYLGMTLETLSRIRNKRNF